MKIKKILMQILAATSSRNPSAMRERDCDLNSCEADEIGSGAIIQFVNHLLDHAAQAEASDLHLEPFEKECLIRYRIDGTLYEMKPLPATLAGPVISRIKVMAHLNIAERRLPQDGRIERLVKKKRVDFRVSTLATQFGESVVLRLLDHSKKQLTLPALHMPKIIKQSIVTTLEKPHGLFIVTGPTGSGKTTTLYACLQHLLSKKKKLLTAEDPIEYELDGVMQVSINDTIGLSFPSLLRSFLRHDPDVIMIGEIRDEETAKLGIQASLTGHLVLTTLHTNDASGAIPRLIDMGVEPLLLATSIEAILAQRLVRKICTHCRIACQPKEELLSLLENSSLTEKIFYQGQGCDACHHTGYRGRIGLFELLVINDSLRNLIYKRASHLEIQQKASAFGMKTLREQALQAALEGITTLEEVIALQSSVVRTC